MTNAHVVGVALVSEKELGTDHEMLTRPELALDTGFHHLVQNDLPLPLAYVTALSAKLMPRLSTGSDTIPYQVKSSTCDAVCCS